MSGELNLSQEEMAIPEGGAQEQMDVSTDDNPGYVSILTKGPGKPIIIRPDGLGQTLSQFVNSKLTRPSRSSAVYDEYGIDDSTEVFLDKKTGKTLKLPQNVPNDEKNSQDTEYEETGNPDQSAKILSAKIHSQPDESEEIQAQIEARFCSQSKVVSISAKSSLDKPDILNSPGRRKYRLGQKMTKKTVGTKKSSPGKVESSFRPVQRPAPYLNWMDLPVREILDKEIVDKEGNIHKLQLNLVPVKSDAEFEQVESTQLQYVQSMGTDIFSEGSIDRPPDQAICLNDNRNPTGAVYTVACTQPPASSENNEGNDFTSHHYCDATMGAMSAPNFYGNTMDKPLDLSVDKPLDLSVKGKSDNILSERGVTGLDQEVDVLEDEELLDIERALVVTAEREANMTEYRTRCQSVLSVSGKESIQGDETVDMMTNHYPRETDQNNIADGNLPSLGRLTLENNSQAQGSNAVQDSSIQDEMVNIVESQETTISGQQKILSLLASGKVSLGQLLALFIKNQSKKAGNMTLAATGKAASMTPEQSINQAQSAQTQVAGPAIDNRVPELDVPPLAMPNLCSLELASPEGEILVTRQEMLRNNLKEKITQRSST